MTRLSRARGWPLYYIITFEMSLKTVSYYCHSSSTSYNGKISKSKQRKRKKEVIKNVYTNVAHPRESSKAPSNQPTSYTRISQKRIVQKQICEKKETKHFGHRPGHESKTGETGRQKLQELWTHK
jgi:hypothetical protein